jgi:hypothetical protein
MDDFIAAAGRPMIPVRWALPGAVRAVPGGAHNRP